MEGGEGEGDGHHYQHYGDRRKIPLAVMVGMYCNRVWPLTAISCQEEDTTALAVMVGCNSDRLLPQPTVV